MVGELRSLLQRCRVNHENRKRMVELLNNLRDYPNTTAASSRQNLSDELSLFAPPHAWFGERDGEWGFWPVIDTDALYDGFDEPASDGLPVIVNGYDTSTNWSAGDQYMIEDKGSRSAVSCGRFDKRGRWHEYWSTG